MQAPSGSRRGFLKTLAQLVIVGTVLSGGYALGKGNISITPLAQQSAAVATAPAVSGSLPTSAYVALPTAAMPAVADPNAQVVPQGKPNYATAVVPTQLPPTPVSPETQAIYNKLNAPLTPVPTIVCTDASATFVTDPVKVLNGHGLPIGTVQGYSCASEAEAVANVRERAQAMMDKDRATHPDVWK